MPWYTFRGPVRVLDDDNDIEVDDEESLAEFDGLTYDDETVLDRIELGRLEDAEIEGGVIELRWADGRLEVWTAYETGAALEDDELDELLTHTYGQWESGLGPVFASELAERSGMRLDLAPKEQSDVVVDVEN